MDEISFLATLAMIFVLAGTVKGVIGMGLPTVSLALVTVSADLKTAMAMLIVPSAATNLWQALRGPGTLRVLESTWPFLLSAVSLIYVGILLLDQINLTFLSGLLGVLLIAYALTSLAGFTLPEAVGQKHGYGIVAGAVNGVLTGMTGSFVVPGVIYLQSLALNRDHFIKAMGMLFLVSTIALAISLDRVSLLTPRHWQLSALSIVPAVAGMWIGQRIRHRLSDSTFRRTFFLSLLVLGAYITSHAATDWLAAAE